MSKRTKTQKTITRNGANVLVLAVCIFGSFSASAVPNQVAMRALQPPAPVVAPPDTAGPLTFQAWKSLRVDEARLVLERLTYENQLDKMPTIERSPVEKPAATRVADIPARASSPTRSVKSARADSRTEQAQMNLEIAQDLTVNDYLVIYLSQFKSREAILDVARRLAPEDIADLLMSYQKLSMGGQIAEHSIAPGPRTPPRPL
jgi:hypothetical protein